VNYSGSFNVNSAGYTAVVIKTVCKSIEVGEDDQAGTTDFYISATGQDGDRVTYAAGKKKKILAPGGNNGFFYPGDKPVWIKLASGSVNFTQEEE
jgi:hypothetical protein